MYQVPAGFHPHGQAPQQYPTHDYAAPQINSGQSSVSTANPGKPSPDRSPYLHATSRPVLQPLHQPMPTAPAQHHQRFDFQQPHGQVQYGGGFRHEFSTPQPQPPLRQHPQPNYAPQPLVPARQFDPRLHQMQQQSLGGKERPFAAPRMNDPSDSPVDPLAQTSAHASLSKQDRRSFYKRKYKHENLDGDDYLDTEWVKPSIQLAKDEARSLIFHAGAAPLCDDGSALDEMGVSVALYFRLLKYFAVLFLLMSVLAVPALWICRMGGRIPREEIDPLKLNVWSLANVNPVNVTALGRVWEASKASTLITLCDLGYSVLFLLFNVFWVRKVTAVVDEVEEGHVTASDYAVMVKGLPRNATAKEVHDHFNKLYNLTNDDWLFNGYCCCLRRKTSPRRMQAHMPSAANAAGNRFRHAEAVEATQVENGPVIDYSNTGDPMYANSWIAEVVIAKPNGDLIRKYKAQQKRLDMIRIAKATMKKFKHKRTSKEKRQFANSEKRLAKLVKQLDAFDLKFASRVSDYCVAAFVMFNCEDSRRYCLEDYEGSETAWNRLLQPVPLLFRESHALTVTVAQEPSDIIWENLETSKESRAWRQAFTYSVMLILLLASILCLAVAQYNKAKFQANVPSFAVCNNLATLAYDPTVPPSSASLTHLTAKDATCGRGDSHYLTFTDTNGIESNVTNLWGCEARVGMPNRCVSADDHDSCNATSTGSQTYLRSAIAGCFCRQALNVYLSRYGVWNGAQRLVRDEGDVCLTFAYQYFLGQALMVFAAVMIVVINTVLKTVLQKVTHFERHDTVTDHQRSVALKVFLAQFINTGLIVLLVNARTKYDVPTELGILAGQFSSFVARWHTVAGTSIVITMLVNILAPHLNFLIKKLRVFCRRKPSETLVTQAQMDKLYRPEVFELSTRLPIVLNTVFVTMAYCSGLPLLLPFAFIAIVVMYWVEKYSILRFYAKPPSMGASLAILVHQLLPWALIVHLCLAVWMYGDPDALVSEPVKLYSKRWEDMYNDFVAGKASWDSVSLVPKLLRMNVFPLAALFVVYVGGKIAWRLMGKWLANIVRNCLFYALCCCLCYRKTVKAKRDNPRFTAPFAIRQVYGDEMSLTAEQTAAGWCTVPDPDRPGCRMIVKKWLSDGVISGVAHRAGELVLTWQYISEGNIASYNMMANPEYTAIVSAIMDGSDKLKTNKGTNDDLEAAKQYMEQTRPQTGGQSHLRHVVSSPTVPSGPVHQQQHKYAPTLPAQPHGDVYASQPLYSGAGGGVPTLQPAPQLFMFGRAAGNNRVAPIDETAENGGGIELATAAGSPQDRQLGATGGKDGFATFSRSSVVSDIPLEEAAARKAEPLPQPDERTVADSEAASRPTSSIGRQPSRQPSHASVNKTATPVLSETLPGAVNDVGTPQAAVQAAAATPMQTPTPQQHRDDDRPVIATDLDTTSIPDIV